MLAPLIRTALVLSEHGLAAAPVDDGSESLMWAALGGACLVAVVVWLLVTVARGAADSRRSASLPPASVPRSRRPASVRPVSARPVSVPFSSAAPASSRRSASGAPPSRRVAPDADASSPPPSSRRVRRRVILLHAETPGQSCHEYNVGDNSGTRGSVLVRVA